MTLIIELETVRESYGPGGGSGEAEGWWARGHHDPQTFIDAIQRDLFYGNVTAGWRLPPIAAMVKHCYQRFIPWGQGESGGYLEYCNKPSRGAYPITILTHAEMAAYFNGMPQSEEDTNA